MLRKFIINVIAALAIGGAGGAGGAFLHAQTAVPPAYQAIIPLREKSAKTIAYALPGMPPS